jgi:hypothetical protein
VIRYLRLFVVLVVLLAGLALVPYIGLTTERFGWQQYAGAYEQPPNYTLYFPLILHNAGAR